MKILRNIILFLFLQVNVFAQTKDLNYFIEQAKTNSPLIFEHQTQNKVLAAEAKRLKAFYTQPEISLDAGILFAPIVSNNNNITKFQWITEDAANYYGYDLAVSDGGQYQTIVNIDQPLFGGSKLKTVYQNQDILRKKNLNDIRLTEHDLEKIVGYQYLRCLQAQEQIQFTKDLIKLMIQENTQMKILVQNGIYKISDLQRLKIELQTYKAQMEQARTTYKQNLLDMNIICGINDTISVKLQIIKFSLKTVITDSSLFIEQYRLDSLNLWSLQQISEMKYKPQVNLFANGGLNAIYLPKLNRLGMSVGIHLSWTIFDGHQRNFMRDKMNILMQDITFKKQQFTTEQSLRLAKIIAAIKNIDKQLTIKTVQQKEYNKLLEIYKTELSQGSISVIDFTNTIRDIARLKQEIILLRMKKQALINNYNYWNY